jgi:hypothetical protein
MKAILELERLGYRFTLNGATLYYTQRGERSDPEAVRPLIEDLRRHREAAMSFLRERVSQEARRRAGCEARATALLAQMDSMDELEWCRQWAEVMTEMGAPCTGNRSWAAWLAEVEADLQASAETEPK